MPARTGEQFLKGLRGRARSGSTASASRTSSTIPSSAAPPTRWPRSSTSITSIRDILLMPDDETGEPIPVSHMIPRSREDLLRRGKALRRVAEYSVGLMGRTPDYMNVTYAGFAGNRGEWANHGNEAGAERLVAYQKFLRRGDISLTHTIVQPTVDKAMGDAPQAGQSVCPAQGRRHRARHRRARRAHPRHPGAVRRRDRGLSGAAAARRRRRLCAVVLHPHERARAEVPVPRQRLGVAQPLRPSAVEPLRRAGRLRDLRRRRDPARPAVHRLQPRRLQLGDDHELAAQHPAADHDPRLGEARLRLGPGAARGGRHQRRRSRDHAHDRRDLELRRVHARGRRRRRGRGARMAGRHVDARHRRRCTPCAAPCRCGSRG